MPLLTASSIKESQIKLKAFDEKIGVLDAGKHIAIHAVDVFKDATAVSLSNEEALNFAHSIIETVQNRKREGKN